MSQVLRQYIYQRPIRVIQHIESVKHFANPFSRLRRAHLANSSNYFQYSIEPTHRSGASGNLSITYFPRAAHMIGTPGIFLIRCFSIRSFVATIYILCLSTRSTRQSSAYTPLWSQRSRCQRSSRAIFSAMRYLGPSFSSSAMTQAVMVGVHFAYRQSIIVGSNSSFF